VPALMRDDGSSLACGLLSASQVAIAPYSVSTLPSDPEAQTRAVEAMDYAVATIHMQGFARIARPGNFSPDESQKEAVQARGREIFAKGLGILADRLGDKPWVAGDTYSIGDSAVFYVSTWAPRAGAQLPAPIAAHFARMKERPAVQRMIAAEGLSI
jgi:glutathione S-transferase